MKSGGCFGGCSFPSFCAFPCDALQTQYDSYSIENEIVVQLYAIHCNSLQDRQNWTQNPPEATSRGGSTPPPGTNQNQYFTKSTHLRMRFFCAQTMTKMESNLGAMKSSRPTLIKIGYTRLNMQQSLSTLELCAGAGGEALGLEQAGIAHAGLIEIDPHACTTLRFNRPKWNVMRQDLNDFTDASAFKGVDIVSGGLPCPPFSKAGKQLGKLDERNLFPVAISIVDQLRPQAVMIENVRGILDAVFDDYRKYNRGRTETARLQD